MKSFPSRFMIEERLDEETFFHISAGIQFKLYAKPNCRQTTRQFLVYDYFLTSLFAYAQNRNHNHYPCTESGGV